MADPTNKSGIVYSSSFQVCAVAEHCQPQMFYLRQAQVLTRHLVSDNAWEADRSISPQDVYRRDMAWLEQCELFMAEVSGSSFGLGFETGYLLGATDK